MDLTELRSHNFKILNQICNSSNSKTYQSSPNILEKLSKLDADFL